METETTLAMQHRPRLRHIKHQVLKAEIKMRIGKTITGAVQINQRTNTADGRTVSQA